MAGKIKGITIELSADATGLMNSLKSINSEIKSTGSQLKDVDRLLKLDPTNTTLLTQKTQLLQEQISNTKEKLEQLKAAQADMDANGVDKNSEQYQALQREIIATEQELKQLEQTAGSGSAALAKISAVTGEIGDKMEAAGKKMSVVSAAIVAFGAAAVKSFNEVDEGMDTVIKKTGATGEEAAELEEVYKGVAREIVADFTEIGKAVGEVSTRFKLTGDDLQDLSEEFLKFANINSMDVETAVKGVDMALKTFNLDQSEANNVMGLLTKTAQSTGISMDTMLSLLQSSGATLKEMGLSIEEAIVLMGNFESAGIDSSTMLSKMTKAAAYFNQNGLSMRDGLQDLIERLQDSSTEADATAEAYEIFGTKAGLAFVTAAKEGKINLSDLEGSLKSYANVVDDTYEATLSGTDKMKLAWQNMKLGLSELGSAIGNALAPIMEKVTAIIQKLASWFSNLDEATQNTIVTIGLLVAAIGPLLVVGGKVMKGISSITAALSTFSAGPVGIAIAAIVVALGTLAVATVTVVNSFEEANRKLNPYRETIDAMAKAHEEFVNSMESAQTTYENSTKSTEANAYAAEQLAQKLQALVLAYDGTATQSEIIAGLVDQLNGLVPGLGLAWDSVTGSLSLTNAEINKSIDLMKKQAEVAALQQLYTDTLKASYEVQQRYATSQDVLNKALEDAYIDWDQLNWAMKDGKMTAGELQQIWGPTGASMFTLERLANEVTEAWNGWNDAGGDLYASTSALAWIEEQLGDVMDETATEITTDAAEVSEATEKTFGNEIPVNLNKTILAAEKAGIEIPEGLVEGVLNGTVDVEDAINQILELLNKSKEAGEAGEETGEAYVEKTASVVVDGKTEVAAAAKTATDGLDQKDKAKGHGKDTGDSYNSGLSGTQGAISATANALAASVTGGFANTPAAMQASGSESGSSLNSGFGGWRSTVSGTVDSMYQLFYSTLGTILPPLMGTWGFNAGDRYNANLKTAGGYISSTANSIVASIKSAFSSLPSLMYSSGSSAGAGLYRGLSAWQSTLSSLAWSIASSINSAARSALQIKSPSKVMAQVGLFAGEGLEEGLEESSKGVLSTAENLTKALTGTLTNINASSGLKAVNGVVNQSAIASQTAQTDTTDLTLTKLTGLLTRYLPYLAAEKDIRFDDNTFAGKLAPAIDRQMERMRVRSVRG